MKPNGNSSFGGCLCSKQMLPSLLCMSHMPSDRVCGVCVEMIWSVRQHEQ